MTSHSLLAFRISVLFYARLHSSCLPVVPVWRSLAPRNHDAARGRDSQGSRPHVGPFYIRPTVLLKESSSTALFHQKRRRLIRTSRNDDAGMRNVAIPFARRGLLRTICGTDLVLRRLKYDSERSIEPRLVQCTRRRRTTPRHSLATNRTLTRDSGPTSDDLRSRLSENDLLAASICG